MLTSVLLKIFSIILRCLAAPKVLTSAIEPERLEEAIEELEASQLLFSFCLNHPICLSFDSILLDTQINCDSFSDLSLIDKSMRLTWPSLVPTNARGEV